MAGTATNRANTASRESTGRQVIIEHQKVVDDLEVLRVAAANNATLLNQVRAYALNRSGGNPGLAISSNFDVKNANAISVLVAGVWLTLAANTNFDTGTAATIATVKWGVALLSVNSSGTAKITWATNTGAGYASEAAAIAAMPAVPAGEVAIGYVTVLAAGSTWTAGTDALQSGTGGTPATTTNYYNSSNPNAAVIGAAIDLTAFDTASDLLAAYINNSNGVKITE